MRALSIANVLCTQVGILKGDPTNKLAVLKTQNSVLRQTIQNLEKKLVQKEMKRKVGEMSSLALKDYYFYY